MVGVQPLAGLRIGVCPAHFDGLDETVARIDAVTTGDVRAFAEQLVGKAPAAMALYGPVDSAPTLAQLQERRAA